MELSESTLEVLKNFSSINSNLIFNEGNVIKVVSTAKNVLSVPSLDVSFPKQFGIYDLTEFLSTLTLLDSPRLKFEDNYVVVSDGSGRSRIKYHYADIDILSDCQPKKDIIMPDPEVSFFLDRATLMKIKRAASVLGHTELDVSLSNNVMSLNVIDNNDNTSNAFSIDVDGTFPKDSQFSFIFNISNLKMIDGDYDVDISSTLISHFVNKESSIEYWVALEKTSTFGE